MPAIPSPLPLKLSNLAQVEHYLGDAKHRNHRGYRVQKPVGHGVADGPAFVAAIKKALDIINGPRSGKETVRVAAYWYVLSFAEGSYLTAEEWTSFEEMVIKTLGSRRPFILSRHEHLKTGKADLNILDPEIRLDPIPHLDRPKTINRLFRLRHASDAWTIAANRARAAIGKAPIPAVDPIADSATTGLARLVRLISANLSPRVKSFSRAQLPSALAGAGFNKDDWTLSIAGKLSIHRWPTSPAKPQKKTRTFTIAIKDLVIWVWMHLLRQTNRPAKKQGPNAPGGPGASNTTPENRPGRNTPPHDHSI